MEAIIYLGLMLLGVFGIFIVFGLLCMAWDAVFKKPEDEKEIPNHHDY